MILKLTSVLEPLTAVGMPESSLIISVSRFESNLLSTNLRYKLPKTSSTVTNCKEFKNITELATCVFKLSRQDHPLRWRAAKPPKSSCKRRFNNQNPNAINWLNNSREEKTEAKEKSPSWTTKKIKKKVKNKRNEK